MYLYKTLKCTPHSTGLLFALAVFISSPAQSATISAASCSYSDISSAITAAGAGDTVLVPAGNCTWSSSSALNISKSITLSGAGGSATTITHDSDAATITISPSSDVPIRITGIYFNKVSSNNGTKPAIDIRGKDWSGVGVALTKIRIDHNSFNKGDRAVFWHGWAYGVADHNNFVNCNIAIGLEGDGSLAWDRPIVAGTADAVFIEDNTITQNDSVDYNNEEIYHQAGARTVIRHNTFDGTAYSGSFLPFDSHGNQSYFNTSNINAVYFRGQPLIEFYNNTINAQQTYRMLHIRGGSLLIHDNAFNNKGGSTNWIALEEEESYQTAFFNPLRTSWAAEDQINNTFIWNNTGNGSAITGISLGESSDATFIQKDRDYFMHAPQSTGGKETWPDRQGSANMSFSSSGANAYYPYAPYTYPHPLISGTSVSTTLFPPSNLHIL